MIRKKGSQAAGVYYDEAVEEALCFGWIDGKMRSINEDTYIQSFSPRKKNSIWSKLNKKRAEKMIGSGWMTKVGLVKIEEAKSNGRWQDAYTAKVKLQLPADLEKTLKQILSAWGNFNRFANSHKLAYITWVEDSKKTWTRERRKMEVVRRSPENIKSGIQKK